MANQILLSVFHQARFLQLYNSSFPENFERNFVEILAVFSKYISDAYRIYFHIKQASAVSAMLLFPVERHNFCINRYIMCP